MKTKRIVIAIVLAAVITLALVWYGGGNNENADNRQGVLVENRQENNAVHENPSARRGQPCDRM